MERPRVITLDEVSKHATPEDLWVIIHGKVYDLTTFRNEHPGGEDVLLDVAGQNGTEDFESAGHSKSAKEQMKEYYLGDLAIEKKPQVFSEKTRQLIMFASIAFITGITTTLLFKIIQGHRS